MSRFYTDVVRGDANVVWWLSDSRGCIFKILLLDHKGRKCTFTKLWNITVRVIKRNLRWHKKLAGHFFTCTNLPTRCRRLNMWTDANGYEGTVLLGGGCARFSTLSFWVLLFLFVVVFVLSLISRHKFRHHQKANPIKQHSASLAAGYAELTTKKWVSGSLALPHPGCLICMAWQLNQWFMSIHTVIQTWQSNCTMFTFGQAN